MFGNSLQIETRLRLNEDALFNFFKTGSENFFPKEPSQVFEQLHRDGVDLHPLGLTASKGQHSVAHVHFYIFI